MISSSTSIDWLTASGEVHLVWFEVLSVSWQCGPSCRCSCRSRWRLPRQCAAATGLRLPEGLFARCTNKSRMNTNTLQKYDQCEYKWNAESNALCGSCLKVTPIAFRPDAVEHAPDVGTNVPDAAENVPDNVPDDKQPDASPLSVVVEHPVPLLPDDVLRLLPHNVLHHALQLDCWTEVVEDLVFNLLVTLVHNLDGRNWNEMYCVFIFDMLVKGTSEWIEQLWWLWHDIWFSWQWIVPKWWECWWFLWTYDVEKVEADDDDCGLDKGTN